MGVNPSTAAHLELIAVGLVQAGPLLRPCPHTLARVFAILITALDLVAVLQFFELHLAAIIVIVKLHGLVVQPQLPLPVAKPPPLLKQAIVRLRLSLPRLQLVVGVLLAR